MKLIKFSTLIILFLLTFGCGKQKEFDSNEWKGWVETESTIDTRWLMHKDLLKNHELKGVSKDSILNLLGKPNSETNTKYYYQLGVTGKGINTGTMTIKFEKNLVVEVKITNG